MLHVLFHSPDRHITYNGHTPDDTGVGGGITARIRLAAALARRGHRVEVLANCGEEGIFQGVHYIPLEGDPPQDVDVLIHNTTGGDLDLTSAWSLPVKANLVGVWVNGTPMPRGLNLERFGPLYGPSNFIRDVAVQRWGVPESRLFVAYNALEESIFQELEPSHAEHDKRRMIYMAHPMKGLNAALEVFRLVRSAEPRTTLDIYGGAQLWGQPEGQIPYEEGVYFHGLLGQRRLIEEISNAGFALFLQTFEEAFGIAVAEALRAGCVVLASPVGAIHELIQDGTNGFLIAGNPGEGEVQERAAKLVLDLMQDPSMVRRVQRAGESFPWNWDLMARVWSGHWAWMLDRESSEGDGYNYLPDACNHCQGAVLRMGDGDHCTDCGRYFPRFQGESLSVFASDSGME